jgi:polar amino acid transport system permease protein
MDFKLSILIEIFPILLQGAWVTLYLTVSSLTIGLVIGLILGLMRISGNWILRAFSLCYVEFIRGTPLLMHLVIIYYALPSLHPSLNLPAIVAGIVGMALNSAAYIAEIFRAGIQSISKGQMEAARSLGMTHLQAMTYVILPQAFRVSLPPLTNEFVALLKDSSLVSTLAVSELLRKGREMVAWKVNVFSPYVGVALLYLAMTLPMTKLARYLEKRVSAGYAG